MKEPEIFYPKGLSDWWDWLERNHQEKDAVWVVFYKKASDKPSITWSDSVDVALCYGWIDSKKVAIDHERSHQFFSKRKANSTWSKINKEKVSRLIEAGLMTEAGYKSIEIAKENGSWTLLDEVEELIVPDDLSKALDLHEGAREYFDSISRSMRKAMLQWLVMAKRPETRLKRIDEIATLAGKGERPKQFR